MESIEKIKIAEQEALEALKKAQLDAEQDIKTAFVAAEEMYVKRSQELQEKKVHEEQKIKDSETMISAEIIAPYQKQADTLLVQVETKKQELLSKLHNFFNSSIS